MRLRRVTRSPVGYWLAVAVLAAAHRPLRRPPRRRGRGPARPVRRAAPGGRGRPRALEVGHVLTADDVAVRDDARRLRARGRSRVGADAVVGRTVVVALFAGEAVLESHLAPAGVARPRRPPHPRPAGGGRAGRRRHSGRARRRPGRRAGHLRGRRDGRGRGGGDRARRRHRRGHRRAVDRRGAPGRRRGARVAR